MVRPGLNVFLAEAGERYRGRRLGLVTNPTGVDERLRQNVDLLLADERFKLTTLFAPEHGFFSAAQDAVLIRHFKDQRTGLPVYSLYGETKRPTEEMLADVDVLLFDIQDVGARFYTYISTMLECMKAVAELGKEFVVLDRPNPINGVVVEGPILREELFSFVGCAKIPIRYGLTVGELATLFHKTMGIKAPLQVVRAEGWRRTMWFDETGLSWVAPSPNMPTLATACVYPGMCLFEGTNLSEGRGTTQPFEIIGAPWIDRYALVERLRSSNLPGVLFRPVTFSPTFSKFKGETCDGIQVHVVNRDAFRPFATAVHILCAIRDLWGDKLKLNAHFDLLSGDRGVGRRILAGEEPEGIVSSYRSEAERFAEEREAVMIYDA